MSQHEDWIRSLNRDADGKLPEDVAAGNGHMPHETAAADEGAGEEENAAQSWDPPIGEFPEIAWRGIFEKYRQIMQGTTSASDVVHFITLSCAVAAALGRMIWMFLGNYVFPNMYLSYFSPTGDHKTTGMRRMVDCALLAERDDIPILRTTGSAEGMADAFTAAARTGVVVIFWEEFAETLARMRWSGSTLAGFLTEAFDCPPVFERSYRKNPIRIEKPTPSILTATTPEWFWQHMQSTDFYGGFGNRFLYFTGRKKPPLPVPAPPEASGIVAIRQAMANLKKTPPGEVKFTPEAERRWIEFYKQWDSRARRPLVMAATRRIEAYISKFAMQYAALEGTLPHIELDQLEASIAIGEYAARCAEYLIDLETSRGTPEGDLTEYLLKWAREHSGERLRLMQQHTWKQVRSAEKFNKILENLCKAERIEIRVKAGTPKRIFYLES